MIWLDRGNCLANIINQAFDFIIMNCPSLFEISEVSRSGDQLAAAWALSVNFVSLNLDDFWLCCSCWHKFARILGTLPI